MTRSVPNAFASVTTATTVQLDADFSALAPGAVLPCTATGTNAISLTPNTSTLTVTAYTDKELYSFNAPNTTTGAVTLSVSSLPFLNLYLSDGTTQATSGSVTAANLYIVGYQASLNSGAGGFVSVTSQSVTVTANGTAAVGQLPGTTTNDSAAVGKVGEFVSSVVESASSVTLTNASNANIATISITAGDWDVWGGIGLTGAGATTLSYWLASISLTSATFSNSVQADLRIVPVSNTFSTLNAVNFPLPERRLSVAGTTTVYLVGQVGFAVSNCSGFGFLSARRAR